MNALVQCKLTVDSILQVVYGKDDIAYQIGETTEILSGGHLCATPHCVQVIAKIPKPCEIIVDYRICSGYPVRSICVYRFLLVFLPHIIGFLFSMLIVDVTVVSLSV